jgi:hypothetical protein
MIEQCAGRLKECRRTATRVEKLALSFLAMFKVAMMKEHLRIAFSDRTLSDEHGKPGFHETTLVHPTTSK